MVAGVCSDGGDKTDCIEQDNSMFVNFHNADLSYHMPGMSDVVPYESTRFCDLSEEDLCEYEKAFSGIIQNAVNKFEPDIIHSHHLWIVSSMARRQFPNIPMVTTCHGSDLRQFQNCPQIRKNLTLIPGQAYLKKSEKHTCHVYRKKTRLQRQTPFFNQFAGEKGLRIVALFAAPLIYQRKRRI